ncbi:MAG: biosynthetic-type acetolactate synthase large subunit [Bacteroidales bacterium]|nr:biosynthetic-type acetolactate synthase large subunit [Bacteroidales bacterium]
MNQEQMTGSQILLETLIAEGVDTIFGYPGGSIMPVYDKLYDYQDQLRHILVRHEQGAIHAAQGYARTKGFPGTVIVTSGPGATNVLTGVADAMVDSTPVVVIAGQVSSALLGTDAFQETDLIGMTNPITKSSYQIRKTEDIAWAVSRAYFIASTGRPGPVVLDFTKDAQVGKAAFKYEKCNFIRSYISKPVVDESKIDEAVKMLDASTRPFVVYGQGILQSGAEKELTDLLEKGDIPAGSTLLGLSALPSDNPHFKGMLGMHGSIASNVLSQQADLILAVGMRFDDRVTGKLDTYCKNAKVIHIDIDPSELGKNVPVDLGIVADAKDALSRIVAKMARKERKAWLNSDQHCNEVEMQKVIIPETQGTADTINPGEVVATVAEVCGQDAIILTDVGQNQMLGARYSRFKRSRSFISSGGLGTMGFGIPATIGAKVAALDRKVCLFVGDGGFQMTSQELGTIMQEQLGVKLVLLNNNWLGNVRQWQELFFKERYSATRMINPDFEKIAQAYGIGRVLVEKREDLRPAVERMFADDKPFILDVHITEANMVFPMVPPGKAVSEIMLNSTEWYK